MNTFWALFFSWAQRMLNLSLSYNTQGYYDIKPDNLSKVTEALDFWNMTQEILKSYSWPWASYLLECASVQPPINWNSSAHNPCSRSPLCIVLSWLLLDYLSLFLESKFASFQVLWMLLKKFRCCQLMYVTGNAN